MMHISQHNACYVFSTNISDNQHSQYQTLVGHVDVSAEWWKRTQQDNVICLATVISNVAEHYHSPLLS